MYPMQFGWNEDVKVLEHHFHNVRYIFPYGAAPVALASGAGAYNYGAFGADIIAAGVLTHPFDIHNVILSNASANADFEISIVAGPGDVEICQVGFQRSAPQGASMSIPVNTPIVDTGVRIRARVRDSTGGSTINIKIAGHYYTFL